MIYVSYGRSYGSNDWWRYGFTRWIIITGGIMDKFLDTIEHYWTDHKKAVIVVAVIVILALAL